MGLQRAFIITGFFLFFIAVQMVTLYGCYYSFRPFQNKKIWITAFSYVLFLNFSYLFLFSRYPLSPWFKALINYILIYPYFIYMLLCLVLFPVFVISSIIILFKELWRHIWPVIGLSSRPGTKSEKAISADRRKLLKIMSSAVLLPAGGCSLYGTYVGRTKLKIDEHSLGFSSLPEEMDAFTIVQISDIHAGVFMDGWELRPYMEIVNELQPDIIVITGDIINWGTHYIKPVVRALSTLRAKQGVFAITGNHDFYGDTNELCGNLESVKIKMLRNQWEKIDAPSGSSSLYLIGVDDIWATRYFHKKNITISDIIADIPENNFKLLLSHNPIIFDEAASHGIHLTLSGHTHAGQIILPFPENHGYSFARLIYKRDYGLYRSGDSMLYINRGLGVIGPPLRINCPREITRIVLKSS
jgi:predicted MPP superfamily phosphohydrolase